MFDKYVDPNSFMIVHPQVIKRGLLIHQNEYNIEVYKGQGTQHLYKSIEGPFPFKRRLFYLPLVRKISA